MEAKIDALLDIKINEIFLVMQEEFGIKNGDVEPLDAYELSEKQIELSVIIGRILRKQKGKKVVMKKFYDVDRDEVITIEQLEKEYNEAKAVGGTDSETFDKYVINCQTYNNGTLEEIREGDDNHE